MRDAYSQCTILDALRQIKHFLLFSSGVDKMIEMRNVGYKLREVAILWKYLTRISR